MYKHLLFDIDNTLLDFTLAEEHSIRETFARYSIPVTEENIRFYSDINLSFWKALERKEITKDELWSGRFLKLGEVLSLPIDRTLSAEINVFYLSALGRCAFLIDGAEALMQELIRRGYDIYAVTNGNACVQHARLDAIHFKQYFKALFISEEMGVSKPEKIFFDRVCDWIGDGDRSSYLIVGDSLTSDIAGGINSGIDTCWYNPRGEQNNNNTHPTYTVKTYDELLELLK